MKKHITIIDDEELICYTLKMLLETIYDVSTFTNSDLGLEFIKNNATDLVVLDLRIGSESGIDVLKQIKEFDDTIAVIMMTAYGTIKSSVEAMKSGAFTYVSKPVEPDELLIYIEQALQLKELNVKISYLSEEYNKNDKFGDMVGRSEAMKSVYSLIDKFKDKDVCVCIEGESGTGKELVARAMHFMSKRKEQLFVAVNCASIPINLMEEEFFGHKKGSFTGAVADKKGKLEAADNGTLFLDEIGDMPLELQGKLLRVLQQKEYTPIGGTISKKVDIRFLAATNRDLSQMVKQGKFREDLYFRLNLLNISMPPLRDRREDVESLTTHFVEKFSNEQGKGVSGVSGEVSEVFSSYTFPGNVRELANIIEYAVIMCAKDELCVEDLPKYLLTNQAVSKEGMCEEIMTLREIERNAIAQSLKRNNNHRKNTAAELGISERGLRNKIVEYGL